VGPSGAVAEFGAGLAEAVGVRDLAESGKNAAAPCRTLRAGLKPALSGAVAHTWAPVHLRPLTWWVTAYTLRRYCSSACIVTAPYYYCYIAPQSNLLGAPAVSP
jgi:hypothetical protein